MIPKWLKWARELQAIAQNGLTYSQNQFDIERFNAIMRIASEITAEHSELGQEELLKVYLNELGYATPKVDVRGVVFRKNKILLVKEIFDGGWTLPGGWADPNESPSLAVERETFEESGFRTRAVKLLALYDRDKQGHTPTYPFHVYKAFFLCEITGGNETTSNETSEVKFFSEDEIPVLSSGRTSMTQLRRFFKENREQNFTTEFD